LPPGTPMNSHQIRFDADLIRRYDRAWPALHVVSTAAAAVHRPLRPERVPGGAMASNQTRSRTRCRLYVHHPVPAPSRASTAAAPRSSPATTEKASATLYRLHREMSCRASSTTATARSKQLHFGGGTPTSSHRSRSRPWLIGKLGDHFSCRATRIASTRSSSTPAPSRATRLREPPRTSASTAAASASRTLDPLVQQAVNRIQSVRTPCG